MTLGLLKTPKSDGTTPYVLKNVDDNRQAKGKYPIFAAAKYQLK
ncbi:hypothetical protein CCACVL1_28103 [Corchorus capsularis]|uniref:Uncharacterized protein n=1 Tax=Corchorus capsularis TaxID=210143 RepID=A0A1R3G7J1_COCAP|nr:hypothetical protein CCACVL1_28103 [Corchorus capsularis]